MKISGQETLNHRGKKKKEEKRRQLCITNPQVRGEMEIKIT